MGACVPIVHEKTFYWSDFVSKSRYGDELRISLCVDIFDYTELIFEVLVNGR